MFLFWGGGVFQAITNMNINKYKLRDRNRRRVTLDVVAAICLVVASDIYMRYVAEFSHNHAYGLMPVGNRPP